MDGGDSLRNEWKWYRKKSFCVLKGLLWSLAIKLQEWKRGINFTSVLMGVKAATEVGHAALVPRFLKGINIWRWGEGRKNYYFFFFLSFTVWDLRSSVYLIF